MAYQVTARKWRPKNFQEMIGQEHITKTLKNAIKLHKISQSYLFSGHRGVGKTTLSRILAKSLNCNEGPTTHPCEKCKYCLSITQDNSLEYSEIDGASNRGIDQIREINDQLKYASSNNKYKIIVIDEVHMLTKEAFNALLKNLEEPPEKVVFIFCTTEIQKIPQTIRSRCQHYEFRPFSLNEITEQLQKILDHNHISYEKSALEIIARNAGGSMRDSQSALDQIIAYSENNISLKDVQEVFQLNDSQIYLDFLKALFEQNINKNHIFINDYFNNGKSITLFFYDLINYINHIIFIKNEITDPKELQISPTDIKILKELSKKIHLDDLFLISDMIFSLLEELKISTYDKIIIEYFLIKLHRYPTLIKPGILKNQLTKILKQNTPTTSSTPIEKDKKTIDIDQFLKYLEKKLDCFIIGFNKPFLTIAGSIHEEIQKKLIKKIKQDYEFDVKLNIVERNKKDMKHLHDAFMEFNGNL